MTPTLYLTSNGLLEPLGQSQILAYLRGLSNSYRIILITYEKDEDWTDAKRMSVARDECNRLGVRWLPQRFQRQPKLIAPAFRIAQMIWLTAREIKCQRVLLIHARSYIPAFAAMIVGRVLCIPFIFDMRALWPEELITAGHLRRNSMLHKLIVTAERVCLRRAAAVVSLTYVAVDYLEKIYPSEIVEKNVAVIPTCADLNRFTPALLPPPRRTIGCLGTVLSGWFKLDWLASFLAVAIHHDSEVIFELTTRDDPSLVRDAIDPIGILGERLLIAASPSDRVQEILQRQTASVMFFTNGLSKLGSSPTRMAEILGCGLPVVANRDVGDVASIIEQYNVGVLVRGADREAMKDAWFALQNLLRDPELSGRCRKAAEEIFSLDVGTQTYAQLYAKVLASLP